MKENDDINQNKTFSANNLGSKSRYVENKQRLIGKNACLLRYLHLAVEISNYLPYHQPTPTESSLSVRRILVQNKSHGFHWFSTVSKNLHTFWRDIQHCVSILPFPLSVRNAHLIFDHLERLCTNNLKFRVKQTHHSVPGKKWQGIF